MYTTENNRQRDSQIERKEWQLQLDVHNIEQQIYRVIVRQRGGGGSYSQMYTAQKNRQIVRQIERRGRQLQIDVYHIEQQIDRERVDSIEQQIYRVIVRQRGRVVATVRCTQKRTIDIQSDCQIERRGKQLQIDVYHIEQQIDRERVYSIEQQIDRVIVRQTGGGGRYRQLDRVNFIAQNKEQIE